MWLCGYAVFFFPFFFHLSPSLRQIVLWTGSRSVLLSNFVRVSSNPLLERVWNVRRTWPILIFFFVRWCDYSAPTRKWVRGQGLCMAIKHLYLQRRRKRGTLMRFMVCISSTWLSIFWQFFYTHLFFVSLFLPSNFFPCFSAVLATVFVCIRVLLLLLIL